MPVRHFTYRFQIGITTSIEEHNSGFNGGDPAEYGRAAGVTGNGVSTYDGRVSDDGTIDIDVMREQPDHGLVLRISEHARGTRDTQPITCVVYGSGTTVCSTIGKVHVEEYALLRFLGENFVDPAQIDAQQHWHVSSVMAGAVAQSDYVIAKNDGGALTINENRQVEMNGTKGGNAVITATVGYDMNRAIPTTVNELTIQREDQGQNYSTVRAQVELQLVP